MNAMDNIWYPAEVIGPRGSTTSFGERAHYCVEALRRAGLEPVVLTFTSAYPNHYSYALFSGEGEFHQGSNCQC